jgi:hypothetical protein
MVWDNYLHVPATLGGRELRGRQQQRARAACEVLKSIYENRLDARRFLKRTGSIHMFWNPPAN